MPNKAPSGRSPITTVSSSSDGAVSFQYDVENRLVRAKNNSNGATTANLYYDPLGRLYNSNNHSSAGIVQYLYDGDALIAEYDVSGKRLRTYGHGTGVDDILWSYEWGQPNLARYYHKNHQGSVVTVTSYAGNPIAINGAACAELVSVIATASPMKPTSVGSNIVYPRHVRGTW